MRSPLEQIWYDFLIEHNVTFKEQVPVGNYIADFVIGDIDLEIDGLQHRVTKRNVERDLKRDRYFNSKGFTVIRVPMNYHSINKKKHREKLKQQQETILNLLFAPIV